MLKLNTKFIDTEIKYSGSQLKSHWIYENQDLKGDSIVSFIGPCDVKLTSMVDLEDVKAKAPIFSESMVHFIAEFFDLDLEKTVYRQRLLIATIKEELERILKRPFTRKGDDLYDGDAKLTVSIATLSQVSTLIHTGINVSSKNTPVKTKGLFDYDIEPVGYAKRVLDAFSEELQSSWLARCKVKAVK